MMYALWRYSPRLNPVVPQSLGRAKGTVGKIHPRCMLDTCHRKNTPSEW
ncbi:hypothetical protein NP493_5g03022 [Ridgeia piscesae]|uniref:Uncharacterized protein n=1 Tax=Ridgeia piscesae TaxID=27915 RepID=A0AAD9PFW5_RIDPI|nr:hypothetical protein NP493_5g03022 [Ridgeia piscesae]